MTRSATPRSRPGGLGIAASSGKSDSGVGLRTARSPPADSTASAPDAGRRSRSCRRRGRWAAAADRRARARTSAAPMKSRKSGAGRFGRDLNSGWNWLRDEPGMIGKLDHLDQSSVLEGARDDEAGVSEPRAEVVVDLVAVPVALVDRGLGRTPRTPSCSSTRSTGCAPSRIVAPRSSTSFCSGSRSMTG